MPKELFQCCSNIVVVVAAVECLKYADGYVNYTCSSTQVDSTRRHPSATTTAVTSKKKVGKREEGKVMEIQEKSKKLTLPSLLPTSLVHASISSSNRAILHASAYTTYDDTKMKNLSILLVPRVRFSLARTSHIANRFVFLSFLLSFLRSLCSLFVDDDFVAYM